MIRAFNAVQQLVRDGLILAGHDRSDGGLVTTLLEMAFAGNCGIESISGEQKDADGQPLLGRAGPRRSNICPSEEAKIFAILDKATVPYQVIGKTTAEKTEF